MFLIGFYKITSLNVVKKSSRVSQITRVIFANFQNSTEHSLRNVGVEDKKVKIKRIAKNVLLFKTRVLNIMVGVVLEPLNNCILNYIYRE